MAAAEVRGDALHQVAAGRPRAPAARRGAQDSPSRRQGAPLWRVLAPRRAASSVNYLRRAARSTGRRREERDTSCVRAGLCDRCRHQRVIRNTRGSSFSLCERSRTDPAYPRYPRVPVERCAGFEERREGGRSYSVTTDWPSSPTRTFGVARATFPLNEPGRGLAAGSNGLGLAAQRRGHRVAHVVLAGSHGGHAPAEGLRLSRPQRPECPGVHVGRVAALGRGLPGLGQAADVDGLSVDHEHGPVGVRQRRGCRRCVSKPVHASRPRWGPSCPTRALRTVMTSSELFATACFAGEGGLGDLDPEVALGLVLVLALPTPACSYGDGAQARESRAAVSSAPKPAQHTTVRRVANDGCPLAFGIAHGVVFAPQRKCRAARAEAGRSESGQSSSRPGVSTDQEPARAGRRDDDPDGQDDRLGDPPAVPYGTEFVQQFLFALRLCWFPLTISTIAFGYGAPGLQAGNFLILFGALDRLGGFFVLASIREFAPVRDGHHPGRRRRHRDHRRPRRAQDPRGARRPPGARRGPDQEPGGAALPGADDRHRAVQHLRADLRHLRRRPGHADLPRAR